MFRTIASVAFAGAALERLSFLGADDWSGEQAANKMAMETLGSGFFMMRKQEGETSGSARFSATDLNPLIALAELRIPGPIEEDG